MRLLRALATSLFFALGLLPAAAQNCTGQPAAGRLCGNNAASTGLPGWQTMTSMLDRNFGAPSAQGTILNRGASVWSATATPSLGLNGTAGGSLTLNGSSTGSATIGVKAAAGSVTFNLPVTNGSLNQVLITDGSGNTSWTTAGAGTVSSVGLALPSSILTVSGSPVTGTGTLTGTLATQTANFVWVGPTTGSAATPTFRALVGADLPNPSASSLGGIQSFAAVGSQWIRQISTSGVPTASQPAFSDISGVITAAQCPNPSASTIGCVQSYAAVANQWINSISTSGVPSSTQPNFTNLAGSATLAQLPTIGNNSVIGNNSGGTAVPTALTATNVLDMIGATQGDVVYRNGSIWTALAPGTNGQVLTSGGAAANPSWTTVTGTGTVTSVATNNGLTGGTITTTGTIGLATIATGNVLAYTGGSTGVPVATTPSVVLDVIGATEGDILYRGASAWLALAPGTSGQVLQTQGAGATPQWANVGSVSSVATGQGLSGGTITTSGTLTTAAGVNTNTINTQTLPYSIATTDCGRTVNIAGGPGTLTLPSVSGFSSACVVQVCDTAANNSSGQAVSLSGFPAPSFARLYMQQCEEVSIVSGAWVATKLPGRFVPTFAPTLFVDTGGSDTNGGLVSNASTNAIRNLQTCMTILRDEYYYATLLPTCSLTSGQTFNATSSLGVVYGESQGSTTAIFVIGNGGIATITNTLGNIVLEMSDFGGYIIFDNINISCVGAASHPCIDLFIHQQNGTDLSTGGHLNGVTFTGASSSDIAVSCDSMCKINSAFAPLISGIFGNVFQVDQKSVLDLNAGLTINNSASIGGNIFQLMHNSDLLWSGELILGTGNSVNQVVYASNTSNVIFSTFTLSGSLGGGGRQWEIINNALLCNGSSTAIPGTAGVSSGVSGAANGIVVNSGVSGTCSP